MTEDLILLPIHSSSHLILYHLISSHLPWLNHLLHNTTIEGFRNVNCRVKFNPLHIIFGKNTTQRPRMPTIISFGCALDRDSDIHSSWFSKGLAPWRRFGMAVTVIGILRGDPVLPAPVPNLLGCCKSSLLQIFDVILCSVAGHEKGEANSPTCCCCSQRKTNTHSFLSIHDRNNR